MSSAVGCDCGYFINVYFGSQRSSSVHRNSSEYHQETTEVNSSKSISTILCPSAYALHAASGWLVKDLDFITRFQMKLEKNLVHVDKNASASENVAARGDAGSNKLAPNLEVDLGRPGELNRDRIAKLPACTGMLDDMSKSSVAHAPFIHDVNLM